MYNIDSIRKNIGKTIRMLRETSGMPQCEFAESCGLTQPQVCDWETGRRSPGFDSVIKLCNALNLTMDELLNLIEMKGENNEL